MIPPALIKAQIKVQPKATHLRFQPPDGANLGMPFVGIPGKGVR